MHNKSILWYFNWYIIIIFIRGKDVSKEEKEEEDELLPPPHPQR